MKVVFFFVFTLCSFISVYGQTTLDSLKKSLDKTTDVQQRADLIASIAQSFFVSSRYDSLGNYADELLSLSQKLDSKETFLLAKTYKAQSFMRVDSALYFYESDLILKKCVTEQFIKGIAINCLGMGSRLLTIGKYNESIAYLKMGYDAIDEKVQPELLGIKSDLIRVVSSVYHHQGKYSESLDYALQGSRLAEQSKVPMQVLKSYLSLSGLYGELSSPENGLGTANDRLRYHVEAKKYMKLSYQFSLVNASKLTQGATAFNLGSLYAEDKSEDSARYFLDEAIRLGSATNFHELLSNAYRMKSTLYPKQPDSSIFYLDLAYLQADKALNPITRVATSLDKAKVLVNQKKWNEAEKLSLETLKEAKKLNLLNDQRSAYLIMHEIKTGQGDYRKALEYYQNYIAIKDSMVSEKNYAKIEELKTKYESDLKDSEIENLEQRSTLQALEIKQKNLWIAGTILSALLIASLIFIYFRQRTLNQQQKALAIENKFLRFQLDPHFLSNALVSIQRFLMDNNTTQASSYLAKFSRLMRQLLEYSREELITIEEEIDLLRNYLDIQKLRLKDKFEYEIRVDPSLSIHDAKIQPMFAQPFVENAIEHGVAGVENGKIEIYFSSLNDQLVLRIIDNGKGISTKSSSSQSSLSTKIIRERIALLNKTNKKPIQLAIGNVQSGTGTQVQLTLPIYS
jgi:two-component sensor histidine kinase